MTGRSTVWRIALVVVLTLAACDSSGTDVESNNSDTPSPTAEPITPETSAVEAGPAVIPGRHAGVFYSTATSDGDIPLCPDPPEGLIVEPATTEWHLRTTSHWVEIPLDAIGAAMDGALRHDEYTYYLELGSGREGMAAVLDATTILAQRTYPEPFDSWIYVSGWEQLVDFSTDLVALVGLNGFDPDTAAINWVVVPTSGGGFEVSGFCNGIAGLTRVAGYAVAIEATPYETFRTIVSSDEELAAFVDWLQR